MTIRRGAGVMPAVGVSGRTEKQPVVSNKDATRILPITPHLHVRMNTPTGVMGGHLYPKPPCLAQPNRLR